MFADEKINNFINNSVPNSYEVSKLTGDASVREYYRIYSGDVSYILCLDSNLKGDSREEYAFFIVHRLFNERGIPVPEVYSVDERIGAILLQDLGDDLLELKYTGIGKSAGAELYEELIRIIAKIQFIQGDVNAVPFSLSFDLPKLMYEFDFFIDNALFAYFKADIPGGLLAELRDEFGKICSILYKPELFVLNHRDFHSRNIMLLNGRPYLIDFQDARMGLPQYDAVSLLRDSYLSLDVDLIEKLKKEHYNILKAGGYNRMEYDEYDYYFDIMAFQRNIKALGTFGYQVMSMGRDLYQKYITPTVAYLKEYIKRRSELSGAACILKRYIEVGR